MSRRRIFTLAMGVIAVALIVGSIAQSAYNKTRELDPSLSDPSKLLPKCAAVKDPIERTILEDIYTSGPSAVSNPTPDEPNGYPSVFKHLAENPHLIYVIQRAFPVRILKKNKQDCFDWEEIPEKPNQQIEHGFFDYPYSSSPPPPHQRLRVIRGEWSVKLDQPTMKEAVKVRTLKAIEDARREHYMCSTISFNTRRITNDDPFLESYVFEIMVPIDWKIPEQAIVRVDPL